MFKKEEALKSIGYVLLDCDIREKGLPELILKSLMTFIEEYADEAEQDGYADGFYDVNGWAERYDK